MGVPQIRHQNFSWHTNFHAEFGGGVPPRGTVGVGGDKSLRIKLKNHKSFAMMAGNEGGAGLHAFVDDDNINLCTYHAAADGA